MKIFIFIFFILPLSADACTTQQKQFVNLASQRVFQKLLLIESQWPRFRLDQVKTHFVIPNNRVWIDNHPRYVDYHHYWQKLSFTFSDMRSALEKNTVQLSCESSWNTKCRGGTQAYVNFFMGKPLRTLHFCPAFFNEAPSTQAETFMHELSHATNSTDDYALAWSQGEKSNLQQAAEDAYHVQEFYNMDAEPLMLRTTWHWLFPR